MSDTMRLLTAATLQAIATVAIILDGVGVVTILCGFAATALIGAVIRNRRQEPTARRAPKRR